MESNSPNRTLMTPRGKMRKITNHIDRELGKVFERRLVEMMKLRIRLEELCDDQRSEELNFVDMIKEVIKSQSIKDGQNNHRDSEHEDQILLLEGEVQKLQKEKVDLEKKFEKFKIEGTNIIKTMKEGLNQITQKYKQERLQNQAYLGKIEVLTQQLHREKEQTERISQLYDDSMKALDKRKYNRRSTHENSSDDELSESKKRALETKIFALQRSLNRANQEIEELKNDSHELSDVRVLREQLSKEKKLRIQQAKEMDRQLTEYKKLVQEEEKIIFELGRKLKEGNLQNSNMNLDNESNELYLKLKTEVFDFEDENSVLEDFNFDDPASCEKTILAQKKLIKFLISRVQSEERERLKTEEQTAQMAAEFTKNLRVRQTNAKEEPSRRRRSSSSAQNDTVTTLPSPIFSPDNNSSQESHHDHELSAKTPQQTNSFKNSSKDPPTTNRENQDSSLDSETNESIDSEDTKDKNENITIPTLNLKNIQKLEE